MTLDATPSSALLCDCCEDGGISFRVRVMPRFISTTLHFTGPDRRLSAFLPDYAYDRFAAASQFLTCLYAHRPAPAPSRGMVAESSSSYAKDVEAWLLGPRATQSRKP